MKKLTALVLFGLSLIIACSEDDSEGVNDQTDQQNENDTNEGDETETGDILLLLKEVYENNTLTISYFYNADSTIQAVEYFDEEGNLSSKLTYDYQGDTIIRYSLDNMDNVSTYNKYYLLEDGNDSFVRVSYQDNNELRNYWIYTYAGSSCSFDYIQFFNADSTSNGSCSFVYSGETCNENVTCIDENDVIYQFEERIRDGEKLYSASTLIPFFKLGNLGNNTSFTITKLSDDNDEENETSSYTSAFVYNESDYPTSEERVYGDGRVINFTYEYYE